MTEEPRLDEFDKDEWWTVCHLLRPEMSRAEFERMWDEFCAFKAARKLH